MKKLVIFDLDGTLLDTIADLGQAANHALRECGYPEHSLSSYPYLVGNGVGRLLERVLPEDARSADNVNRLRAKFTEYYDRHNTENTVPYPGIQDLLDELATHGIGLAVASNKYQEAVTKLVTHYFRRLPWMSIQGNRNGLPVKPDPSIVFDILSKVPTPKSEVLYIGDSGVDMETARRACVESVGVSWGFRPVKELREFHAEHIVATPAAILPLAGITI